MNEVTESDKIESILISESLQNICEVSENKVSNMEIDFPLSQNETADLIEQEQKVNQDNKKENEENQLLETFIDDDILSYEESKSSDDSSIPNVIELRTSCLKVTFHDDVNMIQISRWLTPFWSKDPETWLINIEAQLRLVGIESEELKFCTVLTQLPLELQAKIKHLTNSPFQEGHFEKLKTEILNIVKPESTENAFPILKSPVNLTRRIVKFKLPHQEDYKEEEEEKSYKMDKIKEEDKEEDEEDFTKTNFESESSESFEPIKLRSQFMSVLEQKLNAKFQVSKN